MKRVLSICSAMFLTACAVMPEVAPAGPIQTEAGFGVTLDYDWSRWPSQINYATEGEFLTKDGVLLNRLHFMNLGDGESFVRAARDVDVPYFSSGSTEFEIVELVTSSLSFIGYNSIEADNVRPVSLDGQDGVRFEITGKWENGLNVAGDVAAVVEDERLNLIVFIAPELHYYGTLADEVDTIMMSMNLAATE